MSSHHFVKEGQEPALIIANGELCSYNLLTSIMEWCPYIVVLDGAYERVKELQVTPDIVIGDFDSIQEEHQNENVEFVKMSSQDNTDLEKAIDFLIDKGYNDINVVWATGKRLDHTLNNFATLAKFPKCRIVLYDDYSKAFVLTRKFEKHYERGVALSLFPVHTARGVSTHNLKYALKKESLVWGERSGTSNEVEERGLVKISHESGILILIESVD